jgi:hypothetical protein
MRAAFPDRPVQQHPRESLPIFQVQHVFCPRLSEERSTLKLICNYGSQQLQMIKNTEHSNSYFLICGLVQRFHGLQLFDFQSYGDNEQCLDDMLFLGSFSDTVSSSEVIQCQMRSTTMIKLS